MSKIMYHASDKDNRESILEHGIDYKVFYEDTPKQQNTKDVTWAPRANYLDESLKSLKDYFPQETHDFYEVDVEGYKLKEDAAWFKGWTTRKKITPNRIKLLTEG